MPLVHEFTALTTLTDTFRIPVQYLGDTETPEARAIPAALLLTWMMENMGFGSAATSISTGGTIAVAANRLLTVLAVEKTTGGSRTIKIGTTSGGEEILEETTIPNNTDFSVTLNRYTSSTLTLHFTLTGGTASVLVFTLPKL